MYLTNWLNASNKPNINVDTDRFLKPKTIGVTIFICLLFNLIKFTVTFKINKELPTCFLNTLQGLKNHTKAKIQLLKKPIRLR